MFSCEFSASVAAQRGARFQLWPRCVLYLSNLPAYSSIRPLPIYTVLGAWLSIRNPDFGLFPVGIVSHPSSPTVSVRSLHF